MELRLNPSAIFKALVSVIGGLAALSLAGQFSTYYLGHGQMFGLVTEFNMDRERNIPTFYNFLLILACSMTLAVIAVNKVRQRDRFRLQWSGLSLLFLCLSADEIFEYHERLIVPVRQMLGTHGVFFFAWIIPAAAFLLTMALLYSTFLLNLPRNMLKLFALSAVVYIGGAMGVEMVGGYIADLDGLRNFTYSVVTALEESLEMTGLSLFIYTLLTYFCLHVSETLTLRVILGRTETRPQVVERPREAVSWRPKRVSASHAAMTPSGAPTLSPAFALATNGATESS